MKKLSISALLLLGGLSFMTTACDDDHDDNPTIQTPESFTLIAPSWASNVYNLETTNGISFAVAEQPAFGFTAATTYYLQVSLTNTWNEAVTNNDGEIEQDATYTEFEEAFTDVDAPSLNAQDVNKMILTHYAYMSEEEFVEEAKTIYVRSRATIGISDYDCYSNVVELQVMPYFQLLKDAAPEMWYLIGGAIGDGSWGNTADAIGVSIYPMSLVDGTTYDKKTGKGVLSYTGFFNKDLGFKMIKTPGSWDDQFGSSDDALTAVHNDGGSGNFFVPANGYYTISLNTNSYELTITPATVTPTPFDGMLISGDFNDWGTETSMTAVNTVEGMVNHMWSFTLTTEEATTAKFLSDATWNNNWGGANFPYGFGVGGGANIPVKAGTWTVIFNDIDGFYYFFEK